ncbi:MAG: hypothetical protein B6240_01775 [Desulfobacteraceae bacterium 4572_87]|nr:MAG: hypothetical protein B6240_01775 [Desulfobacteraceae bacterium 4572_87]
MRIGVLILLMVCFLAGCVNVKPSTPETATKDLSVTGPQVKKFCVVGPGSENKKCLQDSSGE